MTIIILICLIFLAVVGVGAAFGAPYLPTRKIWVKSAIKLAKVGKGDVVVDLGSGNGVVLDMALQTSAKRAIGYEINPILSLVSRLRLKRFGHRAQIKTANFFQQDLPADTTVIYLFGVGRMMDKVARYLVEQRPHIKTRQLKVVSFGFDIPGHEAVACKDGMNLYYL